MMPLDATICDVTVTRHDAVKALCVEFNDGRMMSIPLDWFPALSLARPQRLEHFVIAEDGASVSWPFLSETVTVDFLLARSSGTLRIWKAG
ncbi:MAG: DUF2442 domain-containing protein [Novosphingobium sp.]